LVEADVQEVDGAAEAGSGVILAVEEASEASVEVILAAAGQTATGKS
jgi:hypothetical protein